MSELLKKTNHDCQPPTPADPRSTYKWTCDGCGQNWAWTPLVSVRYEQGALWFKKTRIVNRGGTWGLSGDYKRTMWVEAS